MKQFKFTKDITALTERQQKEIANQRPDVDLLVLCHPIKHRIHGHDCEIVGFQNRGVIAPDGLPTYYVMIKMTKDLIGTGYDNAVYAFRPGWNVMADEFMAANLAEFRVDDVHGVLPGKVETAFIEAGVELVERDGKPRLEITK